MTEPELERLRRENTILRGLLPVLDEPCHYCGLKEMAQCARGFPGCPYADDLICGQEEEMRALAERCMVLEAKLKILDPKFEVEPES